MIAHQPNLETFITQHTLWQALTATPPPPSLPPHPIRRAVLDSRAVTIGSLFIAAPGTRTDGHNFIPQALARGAAAIICEQRALPSLAQSQPTTIVDCRTARPPAPPIPTPPPNAIPHPPAASHPPTSCIAYIVPDSNIALQAVAAYQRIHRTRADLQVVAITGSVGKTSTKELAASVLKQRYHTHHNRGNLNSQQGLPLALLGLHTDHQRTVLEMGMYHLGEIRHLCSLAQPHIGLVTNVGPSHLQRLGTIARIAQAKAELIEALPNASHGGIAILNHDDPHVRAMAARTDARLFYYGLTPQADLWADQIESLAMAGIRFRLHHRQQDGRIHSQPLKLPLLGTHNVQTALAAAAVGLVNHLTWQQIVAGLQCAPAQPRLIVTPAINGATIIDDTYNASPASTLAALNLLNDLRNGTGRRRIAILGDMRELGSFTAEGHKQVGLHAARLTDLLVTVGNLGRIIADQARRSGLPTRAIHATDDFETAVHILKQLTQPRDLLLVKGSRALGMDRIVAELHRPAASNQRPAHV